MTYEEALEIAMEELYDAVIDLRYYNKGYHAHIEGQCNRLLTARNALHKGLEEMRASREWVGLTEEERESVFAGSYVIYNDETIDKVEAILKEKNRP